MQKSEGIVLKNIKKLKPSEKKKIKMVEKKCIKNKMYQFGV